uniref:Lipocalin/cytosolic fatty-acid binding domain-containing protein n=1 Tax=Schizaphis graminum TaxID=13262 RepID=A0A2S2NK82_SCHGA
MSNHLSLFSVILIFLGGQCFYGIHGEESQIVEITNITGMWYAVMATPCSDGGDCNIFSNNQKPCNCISANFIALQDAGWQVYMSALNNDTSQVTVDMGGASFTPPECTKEVQGFIYSRATMPSSVLSKSKYGLSNNVNGKSFFSTYKMSIIASNLEYVYMITTFTTSENPTNQTVIWCRKRTPGKKTIWTQIDQHMGRLNMDIHKLNFINQIGCTYPTENQCNEIFFC